jgi:hypothetical protein
MAKHLKTGAITSCGCMKLAKGKKSRTWKGHGDISAHYWSRIKRCASERNLEFSIAIEEIWNLFIKQNKKCALTGLDISIEGEHTASLDRVDSKKGYEISNVQWVHKDVNLMKMDFDLNEFFSYCKLITEFNRL